MANVHEKSGLLVLDGNEATTESRHDIVVNNKSSSSSSSSSSRLIRIALAGFVFVFVFVVISMIGHRMSSSYSENGNLELGEVIGSSNGMVSLSIVNDNGVMDIDVAKHIQTQPVCKDKTNTVASGLVTCPNMSDEMVFNGNVPNKLCKQKVCEDRGGTFDNSDMECFGGMGNRFCRTNLKCCNIPPPRSCCKTCMNDGIHFSGFCNGYCGANCEGQRDPPTESPTNAPTDDAPCRSCSNGSQCCTPGFSWDCCPNGFSPAVV